MSLPQLMTSPVDTTDRLISIAEPVCRASGYELVDIDYTSSPGGWVVRVYIDRPADWPPSAGPIGLEDCERVSRELGAVLDVEDPLPHAYSLEVSSPGLDRPLRTAAHFQRYSGETAKITLSRPLDGRRNFKGTLRGVDLPESDAPPESEATHLVIEVDGTEYRLLIADVASARIVPNWDALLKTKSSKRAQ